MKHVTIAAFCVIATAACADWGGDDVGVFGGASQDQGKGEDRATDNGDGTFGQIYDDSGMFD